MIELVGVLISYVTQIAIILYVLRAFGFIQVGAKAASGSSSEGATKSVQGGPPAFDFQGMVNSVMSQMTKGMEQQQKAGVSSEGALSDKVEKVD